MKQVLILIISLLCTISGFAQNPGSGFENWKDSCDVPTIGKSRELIQMGTKFGSFLLTGHINYYYLDSWYVDSIAGYAYCNTDIREKDSNNQLPYYLELPDSITLFFLTPDSEPKRYLVRGIHDGTFKNSGSSIKQFILTNLKVCELGGNVFKGCKAVSILFGDHVILHNYTFAESGFPSLTIPDGSIIPNSCFRDSKRLWRIKLPTSLKAIGADAFNGCDSLTTIYDLPNSVSYVGPGAFCNCLSLSSFTLPEGVDSVFQSTFSGCTSLKSAKLSDNTKFIGDYAFAYCRSLDEIRIPAKVSSISPTSFLGCDPSSIVVDAGNATYDSRNNCNALIDTQSNTLMKGCSSTIFPNDVTGIGDMAFKATRIKSVILPNELVSIGASAFEDCTELESVEILSSRCSLGEKAFSNCTSLSSLRGNWSRPPSISRDIFGGVSLGQCTLYVPKGTAVMYMSAPVWIEFGNIIEVDEPEDACYVTIRQGEGGTVRQSVKLGEYYSYVFTPDAGWRIHTVSFNGEDVTSLLYNGQYSTPVITENSELSVVYVKDTEDIGQTVGESPVRVLVHGQSLSVSGVKDGSVVSVYDTQGKLQRTVRGNATLTLPSGIYVVKAEGQTFKAAL